MALPKLGHKTAISRYFFTPNGEKGNQYDSKTSYRLHFSRVEWQQEHRQGERRLLLQAGV